MSDEAPEKLAADAPPGDTYGRKQAAQALNLSETRISQLAADGRLDVVQTRPLRVSTESVHRLRAEKRNKPRYGTAAPPESVAEQVAAIVGLIQAESARAIEAGNSLLAEVQASRDELRAELTRERQSTEQLRADNERLRAALERQQTESAAADEMPGESKRAIKWRSKKGKKGKK